jgi:tetratricopeptide (TPR) repeat protein
VGPLSPITLLLESLRFATWVLLAQLLLALLQGLRVGFCDLLQGLLLLLLGPVLGTLLGASWGTGAGLLAAHWGGRQRRKIALALAALGPIGGVLLSLGRFWTSPMIFAFDPFVGFFAGTLYDTVIDAVPRLTTYRAGTAGTLLAALCVAALLRRSGRGRLDLSLARERPACIAGALLGAAVSLGVYLEGPALGHYQTVATISAALGQRWASQRCDIIYAEPIARERVKLLGTECDVHIARHEAYFGTSFRERVTVFLFLSAEQKGALMGASDTYIAKPWRREVYLQNENYPHPVISHELAHVVAGSFARGPFRVAGPLGGWIPDPGRIEGFAVAAAAPSLESDFTLLEWTRAMRDLGLLPPLHSVFRLSFLGKNSATAYTVAGTVVAWLHDTYGAAALRAWYAGADIQSAFHGKTLADLASEFGAQLDRVVLPPAVLALAKSRFDRPAIFGRRCPHVVDRLLVDASSAFERSELTEARASYDQSLRLDPSNFRARFGLASCDARAGAEAAAELRLHALAGDSALSQVQRGLSNERLGDAAAARGDFAQADQLYAEAERETFEEARRRTLAVKRFGLQSSGRQAVLDLLVGDAARGTDWMQSSAELGAWSVREPELGISDYLLGKNLYARSRWREAQPHLARALERNLPIPSVRREALRTSIFADCALGDTERARATLRQYLVEAELSQARRESMLRFAQLCGLRPAPADSAAAN